MAFYCDDCAGYHTANECSVGDMSRTIETLRADNEQLLKHFHHAQDTSRIAQARAEAAERLVKGYRDAYLNGVAVDRDVLDESRAAMKGEK